MLDNQCSLRFNVRASPKAHRHLTNSSFMRTYTVTAPNGCVSAPDKEDPDAPIKEIYRTDKCGLAHFALDAVP